MPEKYKREIEEILRQVGESTPRKKDGSPGQSLLRSLWSQLNTSIGGSRWRISPGRIVLGALAVLLSAIVLRSFGQGVATLLFWAALLLFIAAYALFLVRPQTYEKRWRGQVVSYSKPTWLDWLRKRLKK